MGGAALCIALGAAVAGLTGCSGTQSAHEPRREMPAPLASTLRSGTPAALAVVPPAPLRVATSTAPVGLAPDAGPVPRTRGIYKVGSPYVINGQTYVPAEDPTYDRVGIGSWYGHDFHGKSTANGETFDMTALTAAHPTLPLPSYAYVTNLRNGRTLLVRINDRGPYTPGRIIDLSRRSARALGFEGNGVTEVRVRFAGRAPLVPDDAQERRFLASQAWGRSVRPPSGIGMASATSLR